RLLVSLRYTLPSLIFVYFMVCSAFAACTFQKHTSVTQRPRRAIIPYLLLIIATTYLAQCSLSLTHWHDVHQSKVIGDLACALVYGLEFAILHGTRDPVWHSYSGSLAITLALEPILATLSLRSSNYQTSMPIGILKVLVLAARFACLLLALVNCCSSQKYDPAGIRGDAEHQSLLRKPANGESEDTLVTEYGSTEVAADDSSRAISKDPESEWERSQRLAEEQRDKRLRDSGNWFIYAKSFKIFLPYIWPVNDRRLQFHAILVVLCLLANNGLNVLIPNQLGVVTKSLTESAKGGSPTDAVDPWIQVLIFAALKISGSSAGLSLLRQRLWLPVEQYSARAMVEAAHSHIMKLDAHFHDTKSLSDMLMAIQHGDSITRALDTVCFSLLPNFIDLGVAFIYLTAKFGPWEGLITISTMTFFIYLSTAAIASSRAARQAYSKAWYEEWYIMNSGLSGWTTVASFNQVEHEINRFSVAVQDRVAKSQVYTLNMYRSQALQYLVLSAGLLAGLFLAVWQVTQEHSIDASDFVVLLTYWSQLVTPLNFFAGLGKTVNRDLIDAERLLEIMETQSKVISKPGAPSFQLKEGSIEFRSVRFSYDRKREILKDVSFSVKPGQTIALVGKTGAGKSTILKLLNRFYDVTDGDIRIDGQDIRDVELTSLREHIGVVPQNPVLFNDSIMDNVRYARLDASDEEVHSACKAAAIHEQILGFSDGYNTRVGERGVKLSGGELQRVAIARAILKQPKIVLLDEATSAVDTETETQIQDALRRLCKNRTTFIVAHRLSTIVSADRILVVSDGEIIEDGTHESLISAGGRYAELWTKQIFAKPKDEDGGSTGNGQNPKARVETAVETTHTDLVEAELQSEDGGEQSAQVKTPSGHKREESKLNPNAQEFTPRSALAASASYS
ncbi:hypothetical protein M406DRAFT_226034, partial [Cryphonectria parasitica EP155]